MSKAPLLAAAVGRPQDAILTGITSTVVLVVADLGRPAPQWEQPLLRLLDTAVGIAFGLLAAALLGLLTTRWQRVYSSARRSSTKVKSRPR